MVGEAFCARFGTVSTFAVSGRLDHHTIPEISITEAAAANAQRTTAFLPTPRVTTETLSIVGEAADSTAASISESADLSRDLAN